MMAVLRIGNIMTTEQPDKMGKAFLDLVNRGETRWTRYILTLLIILATWTLGSGTVLLAVYGPEPEGSPMDGTNPFLDFIALNLLFVTVLLGLWIGICNAHKRSLRTLITPRDHIRWGRIFQGFGLFMGLSIVVTAIDVLLFPDNYTYTLDPERFYKFAILVLLLTPFQTTTEELAHAQLFLADAWSLYAASDCSRYSQCPALCRVPFDESRDRGVWRSAYVGLLFCQWCVSRPRHAQGQWCRTRYWHSRRE